MFEGVYIFEIEPGIYKLGSSQNAGHRLVQLSQQYQRTLTPIRFWKMVSPNNFHVEQAAHHILREFKCNKHGGYEVYQAPKAVIIDAVKEALQATGGSVRAAAKILKCAPITIMRRQQSGRIPEAAV